MGFRVYGPEVQRLRASDLQSGHIGFIVYTAWSVIPDPMIPPLFNGFRFGA